MYPYVLSPRTINQWAGWSEAVSHNNGTTQLQLHVEDRKVEQDHDPMIQMIRMFHCCSAQRSGSQLWSSGSRPPVGSVRAGARSLTCRGSATTQLPPLLQPGHQGYCSLRRYLLTTTTRTTDSLDYCMWEVQGSGSVWFNVHVLDVVNGKSKTDIWYGIIVERLSINNSFALKSKTWFLSTTEFHDQYKHLIQWRQKVVSPR